MMNSERKAASNSEQIQKLQSAIKVLFEKCQSNCTVIDMKSPDDGGVITPEFKSKFNKSDKGIFCVDNKFKFLIKDSTDSTIYSVGELDPSIENIKLTLLDDCELPLGDHGIKCFCLISFKLKSGKKFHFFITNGAGKNEVANEVSLLRSAMPTKDVEQIQKKQFRNKSNLVPKGYWDSDWEKKAYSGFGLVADRYNTNDKIILKDFETYVHLRAIENIELTILDIGGGKGRLAQKIILLGQQYNINFNYVIIEPSSEQCDAARKNLVGLKNAKVTIINKTLQDFRESPDFDMYRRKAQCIISSGGPLNQQIVEAKAALSHLEIYAELLSPDGILIATGLSPLLVTKKDLSKNFNVVCTTERNSNGMGFFQNYVCVQKTGELDRRVGKPMTSDPFVWSEAFSQLEWELKDEFNLRDINFKIKQTNEMISLDIVAKKTKWCPALFIKQTQKITEFKTPEDKIKYIIVQCENEGRKIQDIPNAAIKELFNSLVKKPDTPDSSNSPMGKRI